MIKNTTGIDTMQMTESQQQRIEDAYRRLLCLNPTGVELKPNQEWVPAWSSYGLEQFIEKILSFPEGSINDLFMGFWKALSETQAPLSQTMSHLIKDIVTYSRHALRWQNKIKNDNWYRKEDYEWMIPLINEGCTEAQAYFATYVLSVDMPTSCKENILKMMHKSDFREDVQGILSE